MTNSIDVNYEGLKLAVEFDYQPAEPMTHDYPGCAEEIELTAVWHHDEDILHLLNEDVIEKISRTVGQAERDEDYFSGHFYRVWGAAA